MCTQRGLAARPLALVGYGDETKARTQTADGTVAGDGTGVGYGGERHERLPPSSTARYSPAVPPSDPDHRLTHDHPDPTAAMRSRPSPARSRSATPRRA